MAKELNEKTIAEAAKHLNNIQEGKTPILFKKDEGLIGMNTRRKNCQE